MLRHQTTNFWNLAAQVFLDSIALALVTGKEGPGAAFQFLLPLHQEDASS
jgi:hypothetical protein